MKNFATFAAFAAGANALVSRDNSCCFHITASGKTSGTVGQLGDGQNRIGGGLPEAQFCLDSNGGITDGSGRGCIITSPTTQFQCDLGATPETGFSISSSGELEFQGSSAFVACETGDNNELNIYTTESSDVTNCQDVKLTVDACAGTSSASSSAPVTSSSPAPQPSPSVPSVAPSPSTSVPATPGPECSGSTSCEPTTVTVLTTVTVTSCASGTGSVPPQTVPSESSTSGTAPSTSGTSHPGSPPGVPPQSSATQPSTTQSSATQSSATQSSATQSSATQSSATQSSATQPPATQSSATQPPATQPPATQSSATQPSTTQSSATQPPATQPPATQSSATQPSTTQSSATQPPATQSSATQPPATQSSATQSSATQSSATQSSATQPPATHSSPQTSGTSSTSQTSAGSTVHPTSTATSSAGASCPTNLSGEYEYPHLIIPIDSSSPNTAAGTSFNGTVSSTVSTIFNFDIPSSDSGKTCSLIFLFPKKEDLETSSYSFSGDGKVKFEALESPASSSTTFSNAPAVKQDYGELTISPGNSYLISSFACPAGQAIGFEMTNAGSTDLDFFQDYNPSP
ncbi:hypothetical protein P175DRAFT_0527582 [Aspergillus ochraceoroseus IBT 24754]|uniref:Uncharacterized protein n=1 Tax=Aspergillus ochraceoroseus IBT 24754 TaxID=1392256 RepID=A0A2T5M6H2_9EURO|nr:uncharacterized protein P175DRAFT_0527582 [Aspergillus ochraceoroseus IBT 24754]PTU24130.1 hypothetical protein P175DRAFT_0527582 [Aspergillus ochraceoroseus IBT 24754]